jgi:uncharacterized hydrophobic protein (TIGR00271 family)
MSDLTHQVSHKTIHDNIRSQSEPNRIYWVMNALSTVIACYGLFANSPAVVIGAMVVALLLGPIAGISLGLMDKDKPLLRMALFSLIAGVLWILLIAFAIGSVHNTVPLTAEIIARTNPTLFDLMIALAGGAAGAIAMVSPRLSTSIVGVAIATALVPPLSASSILLARGEWEMAGGAFTMAFTNIVAIQFAFSTVLWLSGYRKLTSIRDQGVLEFLRRDFLDIAFLVVLAVILSFNLHRVVSKALFETGVRNILSRQIKHIEGLYLAEVRFKKEPNTTIVRAVVRGPKAPTSAQIAAMQASLPPLPDHSRLELRIRFIHIVVLTAHGRLIFEGERDIFDDTNY